MKANEVLSLLRITRPTLTRYVKEGKVKAVMKPTGHYEYDSESVYSILNNCEERTTVILYSNTKELENAQLMANARGWLVAANYKIDDISDFIDKLLDNKIRRIVVNKGTMNSLDGINVIRQIIIKLNVSLLEI